MAHELGHKWKSRVGHDLGSLADDVLGDFDLTNMSDGGDAQNCKRDPDNGDALSGVTKRLTIQEAPTARYLVRIDQTTPVVAHYRGVAIWNAAKNEITKIVGFIRTPVTTRPKADAPAASADRKGKDLAPLTADQDEATWVATKNP